MSQIIFYIFVSIFLLACEAGYIYIARKKGWYADASLEPGNDTNPVTNRRKDLTADNRKRPVTGAGCIFFVALLIWNNWYLSVGGSSPLYLLIGLDLLAICSFIDDLVKLKVWIRLLVQFIAVAFMGLQLGIFSCPWYILPIFTLFTVGFVNGYNFMDGIDGITAVYSISVLAVLLYINEIVLYIIPESFLIVALISVAVFAVFNFRKKALVYAGDVGSTVIGFVIAAVLAFYMITFQSVTMIVLVSVYVVDVMCTLIRRIIEGENIFSQHKKHIYQLLTNEYHCPQLVVASTYALVQLLISIGYLQMDTPISQINYAIGVFCILITAYLVIIMTPKH